MSKIAVIGGGISSLSYVLGLYQNIHLKKKLIVIPHIDVYQKDRLGGRIRTLKYYSQCNLNKQFTQTFADIGANFIDYESKQQKNYILNKLTQRITNNFIPFKSDFLLFQNKQLTKTQATKVKQRYFYQKGFDQMIEDFRKQIENISKGQAAFIFQQVKSIKRFNNKWIVSTMNTSNSKISQTEYDYIIFGCPPQNVLQILGQYYQQKQQYLQIKKITNYFKKVQFTHQLSVIFQFDSSKSKQQNNNFYSILFLDSSSQITFICSHQQKYPNNSKKIIVVQLNQAFTEQIQQIQMKNNEKFQLQIQQLIYQKIPLQIRQKYQIKKHILGSHYWNQSLLKSHSTHQQPLQLFDFINDNTSNNKIYFCGDFMNKKSRVTIKAF